MKTSIIIITLFIITASVSYSQWLPDVRLTNDPAYSGTSQNPSARCMVTNGDTVNIVWNDSRNGASYEIYYKRSTDGGIYWGSDTRISNNIYMSKDPAISVSGSVVHVVWNDLRDGNYEIYYNRSTDGGSSWGTETRLTDYPAVSEKPSISVSGSVVHVAWQDFRNAFSVNVYYKRSTDSGLSWSADTQLTNDTASGNPTISASGSGVKLVFLRTQHSGYDYGIFYKASTDGGLNWGTEITLLNDSVNKANPILSVTGSSVFVTWLDPRYRYPNYEICYKHSTDGGITWGIDTRLTTNRTSATAFYNISVSGSGVHVIWDDNRDGNYEIYYKRSTDGGSSWGTETRLTNNSSNSVYPFISASGSVVHVLWNDDRDGNYEIYYKRDPTGNPASTFQSQYIRNNLNKPILDNLNTLDTITVDYNALSDYYIYDVNLKIDSVLHTNDSDLEFYLIHNGITDTAIYQAGGTGQNFIGTILNDSASTPISSETAPFTGSFKPHKPLSQFNGQGINGAWILKIYDRATGNTGTLNSWSIDFLLSNNPIGIQNISNEIPKSYFLSQNYPNPFNPTTNIKFSIPKASLVKLVVYDITGREVETLVNEILNAGTYNADWNASNYSSGVYFYKVESADFNDVKKMVLVK